MEKNVFSQSPKKFFGFLSGKALVVFLEKACNVKFLKHGGVAHFSRVMGVDTHPLLACL